MHNSEGESGVFLKVKGRNSYIFWGGWYCLILHCLLHCYQLLSLPVAHFISLHFCSKLIFLHSYSLISCYWDLFDFPVYEFLTSYCTPHFFFFFGLGVWLLADQFLLTPPTSPLFFRDSLWSSSAVLKARACFKYPSYIKKTLPHVDSHLMVGLDKNAQHNA